MHLYFKALKAYAGRVFRPDEEDVDEFRTNIFKRYAYYTLENLMIVNDATGLYEDYPMPAPYSLPGKFYWWVLYMWEIKVTDRNL